MDITIEIPQEFKCPISLEIMDDPVICEDGYTYDRKSIQSLRSSISPMTREPINIHNLIPNRALKETIERFLLENNINLILQITQSEQNQQTQANPVILSQQLILPTFDIEQHIIRSPWDDNIYELKFKKPLDWEDKRVRTTIIALLDTSGSMGESCSIAGNEQDGFSRMDLLKHSMNTIIEFLEPDDELVIIKFNSSSEKIFNQKITQTNKPRAKNIINSLNPGGGTYIWNALKMAFDSARLSSNINTHIMLLTDGQASDDPLNELKRFLARPENGGLTNIKLTTFGFSYDINSKVLFDISEIFNCGFNFIPDASMVGTTFCNYLANIVSPDITVCDIKQINISQVETFNIELLQDINSLNQLQKYELVRYHCYQVLKNVCILSGSAKRLNQDIIDLINKFQDWIKLIITQFNDNISFELVNNLLKDFVSQEDSQEQITKAISRPDWFIKWGYHYLLSLSLAHLTRQCHNFKDQGVQLYGSSLFIQLQDEVLNIFSSLPPPTPSLISQHSYQNFNNNNIANNLSQSNYTSIRTPMSVYVDRSGGCFGQECQIKLIDGTMIPLNKLTGEEIVFQGEGNVGSKIKYIVQTQIHNSNISMCKIDKLIISDYHPVYDNLTDKWVFPNQLVESQNIKLDYMYNIVLESGFWVEIEGFKCVTLGHGLTKFNSSNKILKHDYFGTNKVIHDLEEFSKAIRLTSVESKIIRIYDYVVLRDSETNLVAGILPKKIFNNLKIS
jgi:hypothetical protein